MALRNAAAQRQAEAQSTGQYGQTLRVEVAVKHRLHIPGGDAAAGVRHGQQHLPVSQPQGDGDAAAVRRELQGVGQQVPHRLLQTVPVDGRRVVLRRALKRQRHMAQGEQRLRLPAQTGQPFHYVGVLLQQRLVRQQHGRVGQVVGQPQQRIVVVVQQGCVPIQNGVPIPPVRRGQTAHRNVHAAQRRPELSCDMKQHLVEQPLTHRRVAPLRTPQLFRYVGFPGAFRHHTHPPLRT